MIKLVVFDMAGTTIDENNVVYKSIRQAMQEAGVAVNLNQVLAEGAGKEKLQAIKSILAVHGQPADSELAEKIFKRFKVILREAYQDLAVKEQPHALELFRALHERNIFVALNTGYDRETAMGLLNKLGWMQGQEYDLLVTASDVKRNRPNPDMIFKAMQELRITDPLTGVKVGDSIIDIEEGRNASCRYSIGITTGAHTREQLVTARPDYIIDDLLEILPILD